MNELTWNSSVLYGEGYGEQELDSFLRELEAGLRVVEQAEAALRRLGR